MITFLKGDATDPQCDGEMIIAHVCNDVGGWGRGFVLAVSARWKQPETMYRRWASGTTDEKLNELPFALGRVQFAPVSKNITVANMVAQHDTKPAKDGTPPIRYDALKLCLFSVAQRAMLIKASVHMPRIGCGLAGGEWRAVEQIINDELYDTDVYVYDLEQ